MTYLHPFTTFKLTVKTFIILLLGGTSLASAAYGQTGFVNVFAKSAEPYEFSESIEALGTLEPNEAVDLTLNVADRVQSIYFDDGQRVKKGKTLLSLAQREQIALTEAAEATAEEAAQQFERIERLAKRNAVSKSELDEARRNVDAANAQLRAVQSRQKDRVLVAPFDGVLGFRQVSVGSFIRPGDIVARLVDDSQMRLEFSVPSIFLRSLIPGTEVTATTDDIPGEFFVGEVTTLNNTIDPVTRSIRVRATLPNPERILVPGMLMEVTIKARTRLALAIPEEAVQPVGPKKFVFIIDETGKTPVAKRVEVELGSLQNGHLEVLGGLSEGTRIITEGTIRVRNGTAVKIQDPAMLLPMTGDRSTAAQPEAASSVNFGGR